MVALWNRLCSRPARALLVAVLLLMLANQMAERQAPPRNPELMPYRSPWPLLFLGPDQQGFQMSGMGDPIPSHRPGTPFRVLLVGSSAMRGTGAVSVQSIPGQLQRLLEGEGIPAETINAGVPASDSGQQVGFLADGLASFRPDLVVYYGGNNEFLRLRIYKQENPWWSPGLERFRSGCEGLALYRWISARVAPPQSPGGSGWRDLGNLSATVSAEDVRLVEDRYERNLTRMGELCAERRVPLLLCAVAVNQMYPPQPPSSRGAPVTSQDLRAAWEEGRLTAFLEEQAGAHPDHAWLQYACGRVLAAQGRPEAARWLAAAVQADPGPVRALPSMAARVQAVAARVGALYLDVPSQLRREFGPILGNQVFWDHCHFLPEANRAVARQILTALKGRNLLPGPGPRRSPRVVDPLDLEDFSVHSDFEAYPYGVSREWSVLPPEVAEKYGLGRPAPALASGRAALLSRMPSPQSLQGQVLRGHLAILETRPEEAIQHYRQALSLAPERVVLWRNLGHALMMAGQVPEALEAWRTFLRRGGRDPRLQRLLQVHAEALREGRPGGSPGGRGSDGR